MFVFQLRDKLVDVRAGFDLVFGEYVDVVNPAIPCWVGEGDGHQKRFGFDRHGWVGEFFNLVDTQGQVAVTTDGHSAVCTGGDGLNVPGAVHLGVVVILHFSNFELNAWKWNGVCRNHVGLLARAFGGGMAHILQAILVDCQASLNGGIR